MAVELSQILKEGEKLEPENLNPPSQKVMEIIRRVHEEQEKIKELKYKQFKNLEIYLPPPHNNYGR